MKPGGRFSEVVMFGVWGLAAGNVLVYTVQAYKETFTSPPLSKWQEGAGAKPKNPNNREGGKQEPPKGESLIEKAGTAAEKVLESLIPTPEDFLP